MRSADDVQPHDTDLLAASRFLTVEVWLYASHIKSFCWYDLPWPSWPSRSDEMTNEKTEMPFLHVRLATLKKRTHNPIKGVPPEFLQPSGSKLHAKVLYIFLSQWWQCADWMHGYFFHNPFITLSPDTWHWTASASNTRCPTRRRENSESVQTVILMDCGDTGKGIVCIPPPPPPPPPPPATTTTTAARHFFFWSELTKLDQQHNIHQFLNMSKVRKLRDGVVTAIIHFEGLEPGHQLTVRIHILLALYRGWDQGEPPQSGSWESNK